MNKKLIIVFVLTLISVNTFAQNAFEKYERNENVTSFIAGKKSFAMLAATQLTSDSEKARKAKEILSGVESIQVYTTENQSVASDMKTTVTAYAQSAGLEELMQIKDSGKRISIMIQQGKNENIVTQVLVFIGGNSNKGSKGNESIIVLITGNFNLDDFSDMINSQTVTGNKTTDDQKLAQIKEAFELKISPNPATGTFYLNTDAAPNVKMYDLSGRLVKEQTYSNAGISVSDLTPATYVVEITSGDSKQTQKIIIK